MEVYDADSYKQWIRPFLERLSPALESQLQTIFLIDAHNSEAFHHDPTYFLPTSIGLLEEIKEVIPQSEVDRQKRYEEAGVETIEVETITLLEWFVTCWIRAGGQHCTLPAYLCRHDDRESFDLKQMKWEADRQGKQTHFLQG